MVLAQYLSFSVRIYGREASMTHLHCPILAFAIIILFSKEGWIFRNAADMLAAITQTNGTAIEQLLFEVNKLSSLLSDATLAAGAYRSAALPELGYLRSIRSVSLTIIYR